ncbi:MAG: tetratricopeptide repeat protein [Desulforhopalus sp.]|nr:tetratricopeptide repeat protein [Desulforhopalus sp.]
MIKRQLDDNQIEELLRQTRDQDTPVWLKQKIMKRVYQRKASLLQRLKNWFFQQYSFRLSIAGFVSILAIGSMTFWSGILVERHSPEVRNQQANGINSFADNARANYLIGRGLLTGDRREAALVFFRKAVELEPNSAEYVHWQGVAYWTVGNKELERQSYLQTVQHHPDFVPSLLYLGNSYLESGNNRDALQYYQRVLQNDQHNPEALYNSALAHRRLDDKSMEKQFFKDYLVFHRTGKWAYRAVDHLHQLGDFTYRIFRIGIHNLILNVSDLLLAGSIVQKNELKLLAHAVNRTPGQEIQLVVFNKERKEEARETALNLRNLLLDQIGPEYAAPIMVSWFDTAETISSGNGDKKELSQSILIFSNPTNLDNRRKSI